MRIATLGSGSRGNSVLVESGTTRVLVDAGFSGASLARRLVALGRDPGEIDAVVVTHEHGDHTSGMGVAARRWGWPLFLTRGTARACDGLLRGDEDLQLFEPETRFRVGPLEFHAFATCHDAAEPVAITVSETTSGVIAGIATDLGRATAPVRAALAGCHLLVLEANHDELRLRECPYPWSVKQRIGGSRGHLSNRLAGELARELLHPELGGVLLAHLSRECNDPALALREVRAALRGAGGRGFRGAIGVAGQEEPGPFVDVEAALRAARRPTAQLSLFGRD
ncbi:MAG: MBL fold metallo-hydrolase [Gemmatimonadota bacterium]